MGSEENQPLRGWIVVYVTAALGLALALAAAVHHAGFGAPTYRSSPLVGVEVGLLVALGGVMLAQPVMAIVYLARKRWRGLLVVGATSAICVAAWIAAMILDAPTLLFAT